MSTSTKRKSRPTAFGRLIRRHCESRGWSLRRLAREADVNIGHLWEWKTGGRNCGGVSAVRLSDALGLSEPERTGFLKAARATTKRQYPILQGSAIESMLAEKLRVLLLQHSIHMMDLSPSPGSQGDFAVTTRTGNTIPIEIKTVRGSTPQECGTQLRRDLLGKVVAKPQVAIYLCYFSGSHPLHDHLARKKQQRISRHE